MSEVTRKDMGEMDRYQTKKNTINNELYDSWNLPSNL